MIDKVEECRDKVNDIMWRLVSSLMMAEIDLIMQRSSGKLTKEKARLRYRTIIQNKNFSEWVFLGQFPKKEDDLFRDAWELIDYFEVMLYRYIFFEDELDDIKNFIEDTALINLVSKDIDITAPFEREYDPEKMVKIIKGIQHFPSNLPNRIVLIPSTSDQIDIIKNFLKTLKL